MRPLLWGYVAAWATACVVAAILIARRPSEFAFTRRAYLGFLLVPWRITSFLVATTGLALLAPLSGDPTWDYPDAIFMAVLTYATAPWALGALYRVARRTLPAKQAFVALVLWMLSASWSYDLYILIRKHIYPPTWRDNIVASSVLYALAGLLWNLEWRQGRGVHLAFQDPDWPRVGERSFRRVAVLALGIMVLVVALFFVMLRYG